MGGGSGIFSVGKSKAQPVSYTHLFERFRKACDEFFQKKGEFFKSLKEGMNGNLEKKRAL